MIKIPYQLLRRLNLKAEPYKSSRHSVPSTFNKQQTSLEDSANSTEVVQYSKATPLAGEMYETALFVRTSNNTIFGNTHSCKTIHTNQYLTNKDPVRHHTLRGGQEQRAFNDE